jgi:hypothetical protein
VTSLADSGPGTLRAALEDATGPRTVIFDVSGYIRLNSAISVSDGFVTVAGQTAPGDGITLTTGDSWSGGTLIMIRTSHVTLRFLRIRPDIEDGIDGVTGYGGSSNHISHLIFDHLSTSFATDEQLDFWEYVSNSTMSYNFIHDTFEARKPILIGGPGTGRVSVHHNLMSHAIGRTPQISGTESPTDVVSNYVFQTTNAIALPAQFSEEGTHDPLRFNVLSNYIDGIGVDRCAVMVTSDNGFPISLYGTDNIDNACRSDGEPEANAFSGYKAPLPTGAQMVSTKFDTPPITVTKTADLRAHLFQYAGCTTHKDALHTRAITRIVDGDRSYVDSIGELGGFPTLTEATTDRVDGDGDGIPDSFEATLGTNPAVADSDGVHAASGYTWLEFYLNSAELLGDWATLHPMPSLTQASTTPSIAASPGTTQAGQTQPSSTSPGGGGTTAATGAGDGQGTAGDASVGGDEDSSIVVPVVIASVAVLVVIVVVAFVFWRAGRNSVLKTAGANRVPGSRPRSTRMNARVSRRSQQYY